MPGWVLTPHAEYQVTRLMEESRITREQAIGELVRARQPSQKPIMPLDIAAFGVFLCSDAGSHITGAALPIDGAWQAGQVILSGNKN
jgi:3-hydroxybutyrate dehydrogenase